MDGRIGRREFLAGAAGALALAACGGGGGGDDKGATGTTTAPHAHQEPTTSPAGPSGVSVGIMVTELLAGQDERVAFALLRDNKALGRGTNVEVAFGPDAGHLGPAAPAPVHDDGAPTPYFLAHTKVDRPGSYVMDVRIDGRTVRQSPLDFVDPASVVTPIPGKQMVSLATPTPQDHRGVEPICTRTPPCPLHDVSLDAALREGEPLAVLFATPALCQSRLCGPVLDVLLGERTAAAGEVRFLHVEVYTNLTDFRLTEGMTAYHLTFEPVLFLAGADGVVRERLQGGYDRVELKAALGRLVGQ